MTEIPYIVATAGHVDHGKSSLVRALTGTDPDRLPEEKTRGITIDLGFAHLVLPAPPHESRPDLRYSCGLIDVPGHEDFVANMVSGVGAIDLALLAVAADDGWMPQTEEHLQILLHLGVQHGVVALTKCDLCPDRDHALHQLREQLAHTPLEHAPIVPTSTLTGEGLPALRAALSDSLSRTPAPVDAGKPRLWVDRAFSLKGTGTVVTGTLLGGSLGSGEVVSVQPGGGTCHIRTCHAYGRETTRSLPGMRTALNLPDLGLDPAGPPTRHVRRGDLITRPEFGAASRTLEVQVEILARPLPGRRLPGRALKSGLRVLLQLGSARVASRLEWLDRTQLFPGERGVAQLRLATPLFAFAGDRFVLRDETQQVTLAGGVVLDPEARRARARSPRRLAWLQDVPEPLRLIRAHLEREGALPTSALLLRSRWSDEEIASALARGIADGILAKAGAFVLESTTLNLWTASAAQRIRDHHRAHPELPGFPLGELRTAMGSVPVPEAAFPDLVASLAHAGFALVGSMIREQSHQATPATAVAEAMARLESQLDGHGLEVPHRDTLAPDRTTQQALRQLIQSGRAIELSADLVVGPAAFRRARTAVRSLLQEKGRATASEVRLHLATSRRLVIPLLERLDRDGVTRREGEVRVLGKPSPPALPRGSV